MKELLLRRLLVLADLIAYLSLLLASEHLPPSPQHHAHPYLRTASRVHHRQQTGDMDLSIAPVAEGKSPSHLLRDNNSLSYRPFPLYRVDQGVAWQPVGQRENPLLLSVTEVHLRHNSQILLYLVVDLHDRVRKFHHQKGPLKTREHHQYEVIQMCQIDHSHLQGG